MDRPRLFSTFMLWMLAQLYHTLPEAGDLPKPKLCFFFDEAHLLFDDASDALMEQVERTARLIRSKGVGVYFVTQTPTDIPSSVLAQLGQPGRARPAGVHAAGRRQPQEDRPDVPDHRVLRRRGDDHSRSGSARRWSRSCRPRGVPTPLAATRLVPPDSLMAALDAGPVPGPDRDQPADREVRSDGRPRECPRDHLGPDRGGQAGRRRAGRRGPERRRRHRSCSTRPSSGARSSDRPVSSSASARRPSGRPGPQDASRGRGRARAQGGRASPPAVDRLGHPDRRSGRDLAGRPVAPSRRVRDAVRRQALGGPSRVKGRLVGRSRGAGRRASISPVPLKGRPTERRISASRHSWHPGSPDP